MYYIIYISIECCWILHSDGKNSCDFWAPSLVLLKDFYPGSSYVLLLLTLPTASLWAWLAGWAPKFTSWLRKAMIFFVVICLWHRRKTRRDSVANISSSPFLIVHSSYGLLIISEFNHEAIWTLLSLICWINMYWKASAWHRQVFHLERQNSTPFIIFNFFKCKLKKEQAVPMIKNYIDFMYLYHLRPSKQCFQIISLMSWLFHVLR